MGESLRWPSQILIFCANMAHIWPIAAAQPQKVAKNHGRGVFSHKFRSKLQ